MATYLLFEVVRTPFYNTSGVALSGGRIDTFLAGTTTPVTTYSDNSGTPYGTSITLDSTGRTPYGWYGNQDVSYKMRVYNSAGSEQTQYQQDNITFPPPATPLESFELQRAILTDTGTLNDYDVDGLATADQTAISFLEWAGSAPLTLTGLAAEGGETPADGRVIYGKNTNTSAANYMWLKHNDSGSAAAFRFTTVSTNGQYIGAGGTWQMIYDANALRWMVSVIDPGAMISPAFSSGDYVSADWTVISGNVTVRSFRQHGKFLHVQIEIAGATAAGGRPGLGQTIPGGFSCTPSQSTPCLALDAAAIVPAYAQTVTTAMTAALVPAGNWTAGAVNLSVVADFMVA
jgi:hypothetical protein